MTMRLLCMTIFTLICILGGLSFVWTPHDMTVLTVSERFAPLSLSHLLGTDQYGRDIVSMLMVGTGYSLGVAFLATFFGAVVGILLGAVSVLTGRVGRASVVYGNDFIFAFPAIITAVMLTAVFGHSVWIGIFAIGLFNVPVFTRVARGLILSLMVREYVTSARALGQGTWVIFRRHIIPNMMPVLRVQGILTFALSILAEASLSYMGLGVQPPYTSLGRMLFENQTFMMLYPQLSIYPGLVIVTLVLTLTLSTHSEKK